VRRVTVELPEADAAVLDALGFLDGQRPSVVARELLCAELCARSSDSAVQALLRARRRYRARLQLVPVSGEKDADGRDS
jgi:hypothetical protein